MAKIPRETLHATIHREVMCVPPPSGGSARKVYEQLLFMEQAGVLGRHDTIERRLDLITYLFKDCEKATASAFERQMVIAHNFYVNNPDTKKAP